MTHRSIRNVVLLAAVAILWVQLPGTSEAFTGDPTYLELPYGEGFVPTALEADNETAQRSAHMAYIVEQAGTIISAAGETLLPPGTRFDRLSRTAGTPAIVELSLPEEAGKLIIDAIQAIADARGLTLETATATTSAEVQQAAEALVGRGVDVILVPTISTVDSGQAAIAQVAADSDVPVVGSASAQAGTSAAVAVGADYYAAGYDAGERACAILSGEATPAELDVLNIGSVAVAVTARQATAGSRRRTSAN